MRAALFAGDEATSAWREWNDLVPPGSEDPDSHRLFPLIHEKLLAAGFDRRPLAPLGRVRRRSGFAMSVLLRDAESVIASLSSHGIEVMLLKGLALLHVCYPEPALRPMSDFDILVRRASALDAAAILEAEGWSSKRKIDVDSLAVQHGCEMVRAGRRCDLHWSMMWEQTPAADEVEWRRARQVRFAGCEVRIPDYADLLVHLIVHGTRVGDGRTVRWIVDSGLLIRTIGEGMDWDEVESICRERGFEYPVGEALSYLRERFGAEIPESVAKSLASVRPPRMRRMTHVVVPRPPGRLEPFVFLPTLFARFVTLSRGLVVRRRVAWLATALEHSWGIDRAVSLPLQIVLRGGRKLRRGIRYFMGSGTGSG